MTRQILFFLPLLLLFPLIFMKLGGQGIDGIMYVGPVADFLSAVVSIVIIVFMFKKFDRLKTEVYHPAV